jgi:hypothetical protein|tara:strand:+ start:1987 stop:2457 length:471 start_codon:yes stop_codon:yes gene_type:complete
MAHVTSRHIEVDGKFYLVGGPNDEIIGGPYASAAEADNQSMLASQMVGEAPIGDYKYFLSSPVTSTRFEGRPFAPPRAESVETPSWIDNVISRVIEEFRGPVGDKAYRQPPRLDWKKTTWPVVDWPGISPGRKKRPNLPEVEEWNPSNDYKIKVIR